MDDATPGALNFREMTVIQRLEQMETTLIKEFREWAVPIQIKQKVSDITLTGINERLDMIEDRLRDLEEG